MYQRFKNDDEYFGFVRKYQRSNSVIYYLYLGSGILLAGLLVSEALDFFKIMIPTQGQLLVIMGVIAIFAMNRFRKSGWIQEQENKSVEKAKKQLEKVRKEFAEKGMEYFINKSEKDLKLVLYIGILGLFIMITMMTLPEGLGIVVSSIISIVVGSTSSVIFIKSKYFTQIVDFLMKKTREDYTEGYFYRYYD